jgi:MFS family permease
VRHFAPSASGEEGADAVFGAADDGRGRGDDDRALEELLVLHEQVDHLVGCLGVGIGEAGGTPSCNSIVCDYFPASRRPMALTIFALGAPIGAWLGSDIAGLVSLEHGWRAAFLVLGIPGILLALPEHLAVLARENTLKPIEQGAGFLSFVSPYMTSMPAHAVTMGDLASVNQGCPCGNPRPYFRLLGRAGTTQNKSCAIAAAEILGGKS